MTWRTAPVTGVIPGAGDQLDMVNLDTGGEDGTRRVLVPPHLSLRVGDDVVFDDVDGKLFVHMAFNRRASSAPVTPRVLFGAEQPAGAKQVAAVWDATNLDGTAQPTLYATYQDPGPAPQAGTLTLQPTSSRTWDPTNGWDNRSAEVRQGAFGNLGAAYGVWCYPSIADSLAGHVVTGAQMRIRRDDGGRGGRVPMRLWVHTLAVAPTSGDRPTLLAGPQTIAAAAPSAEAWTEWFDLPSDLWRPLVTGAAAGVAIYSPAADDYAVCVGVDQDRASGEIRFAFSS